MKYIFICEDGHMSVRDREDYDSCGQVAGPAARQYICARTVYRWQAVEAELQPEEVPGADKEDS